MQLKEILYKIAIRSVVGTTDVDVAGLCIDSRKAETNFAFIAIAGTVHDGNLFIPQAIQAGATVVVCEILPTILEPTINYIVVEDALAAVGTMAANFYQHPSAQMKVVGVTGTNGKTTVVTLLYKVFSSLGYACGLIGTVENRIRNATLPSTHTTPDAISLQALMAQMLDAGCSHVFMEVSSHAIHQQRIHGIQFAAAVFTNITHDHLDYHKTFDEYIAVKKLLFDYLPASAVAITNFDDRRGQVMLQNTKATKRGYAIKSAADVKGKILENSLLGLVLQVNDIDVHFRLVGTFNAYNLLAVYATGIYLGENKETILQHLSMLDGAEGRFETQFSEKDKVLAIVDYAHTPDALENVLDTIISLKKGFENIITVVGCGGDRDKSKRPLMAAVACSKSEKVIFTSDNPRTEEPQSIIDDMERGLPAAAVRKYISIVNRKDAIKAAINMAAPGDIILVAGKGHEKYQEINGVKNHFDDKEAITEFFSVLNR